MDKDDAYLDKKSMEADMEFGFEKSTNFLIAIVADREGVSHGRVFDAIISSAN